MTTSTCVNHFGRFVRALTHAARTRAKRSGLPTERKRVPRGMTIIEIMVVVVIISLVAGVVGVSVFNQLSSAQVQLTKTQVKNTSEALDLYKLSTGRYPSTAEGLEALVKPKDNMQPFMKTVPNDPWGKPLNYRYPGQHNQGSFDLWSTGVDQAEGGGDDITNWEPASS